MLLGFYETVNPFHLEEEEGVTFPNLSQVVAESTVALEWWQGDICGWQQALPRWLMFPSSLTRERNDHAAPKATEMPYSELTSVNP